jgi:hypothetical protein
MANKLKITLLEPIVGHGGMVKEIWLREPTARELMSFGDPWSRAFSRDGLVFQSENVEIVKQYVDACVVYDSPGPKVDELLLEQLGLADGLRVKDAVLGFFTSARLAAQKFDEASAQSKNT